jgi:hypothetical protein
MGIIRAGKLDIKWGIDRDSNVVNFIPKKLPDNNGLITTEDPAYDETIDKIYKEISSSILPVSAGRQTTPDQKSISNILGEMLLVQPDFDVEWLEAIEQLAKHDSDVSAAVDNVSLANTKVITTFDEGVPESMAREMQKYLTESRDKWYNFADGINGWIDDSLTQCAITGAISYEVLPSINLDAISQVVMVNPKNIMFRYVNEQKRYLPVQKIPKTTMWTGGAINGQYKILNQVTYRYLAMKRMGESPYAIPPFLSAMAAISIKRSMEANMKSIIKKIGLLGFLKVMLNAPTRKQTETDTEYYERLKQVSDSNVDQVRTGLESGFMVGFDKMQTIEMQKTDTNVNGAQVLTDMNDTSLMQGLKQHGEFMNRPGSTSETFGRVLLAKLGRQLSKYQQLAATGLSYIDLMHLQLAGYPVEKVINTFEPVMLGDKEREANARSKTIDNARKLWADGIINKTQYAQEVGFDEADQEEIRFQLGSSGAATDPTDTNDPSNPSADQNPTNGKTTEKNQLLLVLPEEYQTLLATHPEHGMGYHLVKIHTTRGKFDNVTVTNGKNAWISKLISTAQVVLVEVKKKSELITHFEAKLQSNRPMYYAYHGHSHDHSDNFSFGVPDDEKEMWGGYSSSVIKEWNKTIKIIQQAIAAQLKELGPNVSLEAITSNIIYHTYSNINKHFQPGIEPIIKEHVQEIYSHYRKSMRPWEKVAAGKKDLPDAVFNLTDIRAMKFFEGSDNLYLGKFITDIDTKAKINQYIRKWYLDNDREIGRSPKAINQFKEEFPTILEGESWKIRRVIDTTVNRMRNTGAISYMEQAEVTNFIVVALGDGVICPYCTALNGKVMAVKTEYSRIQRIMTNVPEALPSISPFVTATGIKAEDIKEITGETLQDMGIGMPAYHPHCRCTVGADI